MPYGDLPPLTDDEFERLLSGASSPADYPEEDRRAKTHAFFERLMSEHPHQWQAMFDNAQEQFATRMDAENGRASTFNPSGRRFKRKERKLMAQQWAFDAGRQLRRTCEDSRRASKPCRGDGASRQDVPEARAALGP